jgi:hypothetical protein
LVLGLSAYWCALNQKVAPLWKAFLPGTGIMESGGGFAEEAFGGGGFAMPLNHADEFLHALEEMGAIFEEFVVVPLGFPEELGFVGSGEVPFGMVKAREAIAAAMDDHDGNIQTRQFGVGVVFYGCEHADGHPGEEVRADIRDAGEGVLEDDASERSAEGQFADDAAAERFAEGDHVRGGKVFGLEPFHRRESVQISAFFTGATFTEAEAAVIELENVETNADQGLAKINAMTDVAGVAVTDQGDEVFALGICRGREKTSR